MASDVLPSCSPHSSASPFGFDFDFDFDFDFKCPCADFSEISKIAVDSCLQNLEKSEESSDDDDDDNNDADYFPQGYDRSNSRMFTVKEAPQAVVDWYTIALDKSRAKKSTVKKDALGHLLAMRWEIYYIQKKNKRELRYKSPSGRVYISLRTACKAYIDQGAAAATTTTTTVSGTPREKKDSRRRVWKGKEIASSKKQVHESSSEGVKSPVPPVSNLGKRKTPPRATEAAAETSSTRRHNSRSGISSLIDQGIISPGDKVYYKLSGKDPLATGRITNEGIIRCDCCSNLFRISSFEAHSGSTKRRPAANIFLENGLSLLDCQKQLLPQTKSPRQEPPNNYNSDKFVQDQNDSVCSVCYFGGELILCDHCPAAFHGSCLGFKAIPLGEWFCPSCCCKICGQGAYDSNGPSSSNRQIDSNFVKCVQCEQKVHIGCVNSIRGLREDDPNPNIDRENWFCTKKCENIHMGLQKLLWKEIKIPMGEEEEGEGNRYLSWTLMKHTELAAEDTHHRKKLNHALAVMHESFRPVKDPMTKNDLIENVIYSRRSELKRLNFGGFYTVALEKKNKVMTVATVRVYGEEVAEVPLVATRLKHRRQGMCRALMKELEQQLMNLGVKRLTLPAVPEALGTWTGAFGFSRMAESDRSELVKYTLLSFQHTVMCQKLLIKGSPDDDIELWGMGARKRLKKQSYVVEDEIFDGICCDGWSSISDYALFDTTL